MPVVVRPTGPQLLLKLVASGAAGPRCQRRDPLGVPKNSGHVDDLSRRLDERRETKRRDSREGGEFI